LAHPGERLARRVNPVSRLQRIVAFALGLPAGHCACPRHIVIRRENILRLYSYATGEPVETVEMHVLAQAYRRSVHASEPIDSHVIAGADLVIDFGPIEVAAAGRRPGQPRDDVDGDSSEDHR
jgi:hypothetical protein